MIRLGEFMLVIAECLFKGGGCQIKECETLTKGKGEKYWYKEMASEKFRDNTIQKKDQSQFNITNKY